MLDVALPALSEEDANQTPPLTEYNVVTADRALVEGVRREGAGWSEPALLELGETAGSTEAIDGASKPTQPAGVARVRRGGFRRDEVEYHPSYHRLMETAIAYGLHASSWRRGGPGAHVARRAMFYAWSQVDAGHGCPISMTHAAVAALRVQPDVAAHWMPRSSRTLRTSPRCGRRPEERAAFCSGWR